MKVPVKQSMKLLVITLWVLVGLCLLMGLWWVLTQRVIAQMYSDKVDALSNRLGASTDRCTEAIESHLYVRDKGGKGEWKHYHTKCNDDGTTTNVYVDNEPPP